MRRALEPNVLAELVRRVAAAHPRRIVFFGSAARGELHEHSDLDILLVLAAEVRTSDAEEAVCRGLWGFGIATDVVAVNEDIPEQHRTNPYLVCSTALREGRELYRASS